ncbi:MAG: flavoprotein [Planctomycetota bacterium]|jgi:phosphopantothenoylcysteine decarboxylase/phosphopantothenate--cysteine ligase
MPTDQDRPLEGLTITLGVTGSIAAFKAVELAGLLVKAGAEVPVILTESAQKFIQPLSFEAITHRPVYTGMFAPHTLEPCHISLAERSAAMVIAPVTANTIAKLALGLADDLLPAVAMATRAPLLLGPAMNDGMWTHPATATNTQTLIDRGVTFVGPEEGRLASGKIASTGRFSPPTEIFKAVCQLIERPPHVC